MGALFNGPEEDPNAGAQAELQARELGDTRKKQATLDAEKAAMLNAQRGGRLGRQLLAFTPAGGQGGDTLG